MADVQDQDIPAIYSQEEINEARDELKAMRPEDLLALRGERDRALANIILPEAVAICFTEVYTPQGNKVSVTCRGVTGQQAIDALADTLRYIGQRYDMHVSHPAKAQTQAYVPPPPPPPESEYIPDLNEAPQTTTISSTQPQSFLDMEVQSITRERKRNGQGDLLKVRGGPYMKYGVPAYDNFFPKNFDVTQLQYGVETTVIPPGMEKARVDTTKKPKVIQFYS